MAWRSLPGPGTASSRSGTSIPACSRAPQAHHLNIGITECGARFAATPREGLFISDKRVRSSLRTVPRSQQGHSVASRASFFVASNDSVIVDRSSSSLLCLLHSSACFACCSLLLLGRPRVRLPACEN